MLRFLSKMSLGAAQLPRSKKQRHADHSESQRANASMYPSDRSRKFCIQIEGE